VADRSTGRPNAAVVGRSRICVETLLETIVPGVANLCGGPFREIPEIRVEDCGEGEPSMGTLLRYIRILWTVLQLADWAALTVNWCHRQPQNCILFQRFGQFSENADLEIHPAGVLAGLERDMAVECR
jgi:hypothetical protein